MSYARLKRKLKQFETMLNIFELWRVWENVEPSSVYANKFFRIAQPYFSTNIVKQSLCQLLLLPAFKIFNRSNLLKLKKLNVLFTLLLRNIAK